jgi:hypothetical protein
MTIDEAKQRAEDNISSAYKHANYERTVQLKKEYLQVLTGEEIDDLLPQFEIREDKELWNQRKKLTIENLSPTISPICEKFYGVARLHANKYIQAKNVEKQKFVEGVSDNFYNRQSIEQYMDDILDEIAISDPNAFLAISFMPFEEGQHPKIYPTIFGCEEVLDYVYNSNGELSFLFICQQVQVRAKIKGRSVQTKTLKDYYCISLGNIISYKQLSEDRSLEENSNSYDWTSQNGITYRVQEVSTYIDSFENKSTPAIRLGYIQHKKHRSICISPIHPAIPILKDMIRDKSEYDVSKRCHVFPQKVMYDDACTGETHINASRVCNGGFISGTKDTCSTCSGTGFKPHTSGQQIIRIKRPRTKEEFMPIKELISYVSTDLEAVKMLGNDIERNMILVEGAIFSSGLKQRNNFQSRNSEMPTATQMTISNDEYNYVLDAWAKNRSKWYCFAVKQIGAIYDTPVEVSFRYNGKYVLETQEDLIVRLKNLTEAGVSENIIIEADLRIAKIFFDENANEYLAYSVKTYFLPFKGKSKEEVIILLENDNVPKLQKILYANFQTVFEIIEETIGVDFYLKSRKEQRVIVESVINAFSEQLAKEIPNDLLGLPK